MEFHYMIIRLVPYIFVSSRKLVFLPLSFRFPPGKSCPLQWTGENRGVLGAKELKKEYDHKQRGELYLQVLSSRLCSITISVLELSSQIIGESVTQSQGVLIWPVPISYRSTQRRPCLFLSNFLYLPRRCWRQEWSCDLSPPSGGTKVLQPRELQQIRC